MKLSLSRAGAAIAAAGALFVYGCGGGGGGSSPTASSSSLTGTAATGAALANANVAISNKAGTSPCTEASIITTALGSYTCTLKSGETAPFFIVVTDPTGNTPALVSIATDTPAAGTPLVINATPLTTAIVAQLNGGDALGVVNDKTKFVPADFAAIKANVIAQLKAVLDSIGVPAGYDPFTTKMTAATATTAGDTADKVLDIVKITTDSTGKPALTVVGSTTAPITIATKDPATATATVTAPPAGVSELSIAAQSFAQAFNSCWALPVAQRVTLGSNGSLNGVASACNNIVTTGNNANGEYVFLHNGYNGGQWYYNLLTSNDMTGAQFSVPEIVAFYPANTATPVPGNTATYDKAVINIRYLDKNGNPGNDIQVVARIPNTSSAGRPTNWWIVGNQHQFESYIQPHIRRQDQFGPNTLTQGPSSRFQAGLSINIPRNSFPNTQVASVLITGVGLPDTGLWFFNPGSGGTFVLSDRRNPTPVALSQHHDSCGYCGNFWMARTKAVTGADAKVYNQNPRRDGAPNWAQGALAPFQGTQGSIATYVASTAVENSYNGSSGTRPVKGSLYNTRYFDTNGNQLGFETTAIMSDLVDPANGVNLQWNSAGPKTLATLDPLNATYNGLVSSLPVDWIQNPGAEQIRGLSITLTNGDDDNTTPVPKGATSIVAQSPSPFTFASLTGALQGPFVTPFNAMAQGYREIFLGYRTTDGGKKSATFLYYP